MNGHKRRSTRDWLRIGAVGVVTAVFVGQFLTAAHPAYATDFSRPTNISISMNDSGPGDTGVTYGISFYAATTATLEGIVVDFCSNSPVIGQVCTAPSGLSVGTPTVSGWTGITSSWSATSANSGRTLELTYATGTSISAGAQVAFNVTTVTNPTAANTTFYARILTYTTTSGATSYNVTSSSSSIGTPVDAGGVALSTSNDINIDFSVPETLSFCVYTNSTCAGGGNSVLLGNTLGVLSSSGPYVDKSTKYDIAENAGNGVTINIQGSTLKSGTNSITGLTTPTSSSAGTSQFGICTYTSSGSGLAPYGDYDGNGGSGGTACSSTTQTSGTGATGGSGSVLWYFNTTNTNSTYGDEIASMASATKNTGVVAMMANISSGQPAGIYMTTLTFIATSMY